MIDRYQHLLDLEENFVQDRPTLKNNNDLLTSAALLEGETNEYTFAILDFLASPTPDNRKEALSELADIQKYLLKNARLMDADLYEETKEKYAFDTARYPSKEFSNGKTFGQAYSESREWVKQRRFKEQFYH